MGKFDPNGIVDHWAAVERGGAGLQLQAIGLTAENAELVLSKADAAATESIYSVEFWRKKYIQVASCEVDVMSMSPKDFLKEWRRLTGS